MSDKFEILLTTNELRIQDTYVSIISVIYKTLYIKRNYTLITYYKYPFFVQRVFTTRIVIICTYPLDIVNLFSYIKCSFGIFSQ